MLTETLTANSSSFLLRHAQLQAHFVQSLLQGALSVCVDQLKDRKHGSLPVYSSSTVRSVTGKIYDNSFLFLTSAVAILASRLCMRASSARRTSVRSVNSRPRRAQSCLRRASSVFCLQGELDRMIEGGSTSPAHVSHR